MIVPASNVRQGQDLPADRRDPRVIAVHGQPLVGLGAALRDRAVTVLSGLDYFFGVRRLMAARGGAQPEA